MTTRRVINRESRQCSQIRPFLYVGGLAALSPRTLSRFCTTINLIPGFRITAPGHMKVLHIPLLDDESTDLSPYFTIVFKEIDSVRKSLGRVLLLCAMGISRSATFAISYLMCIEKMSLYDAYKHVQYCRNIICPNVGFFQQMIDLEQKLYGKKTVQIIEPIQGVKVADVVWNELYQDMMESLSQTDRQSIRSLNSPSNSDTRSLRSLNLPMIISNYDSRELSSCHLAPSPAEEVESSVQEGTSIRVPRLALKSTSVFPRSALRDKSKRGKKKRWRLNFSKDVT
uniref:Tyrosine-protein phosphatase domain-containing protein n=1 Tax=Angiostrongylus cantonensis TaxID=6313 RepID=A0A158P6M5_ANGCA